MPYLGGIEAGGTKFVCATGSQPGDVELAEFPTGAPAETIRHAVEFFQAHPPVSAIGIASFGPIDLDPASARFGYITNTPKLAWRNFDFVGAIRKALNVPVAFDTDVNAAALGEFRWGAAQGLNDFLYVTVGTGIGGGGMLDGRLLHGRTHPEMGHVRIPHDLSSDPFPGNCPYHGDCLEGLAAAPALEARWGSAPESLPDKHAAWDLEAHYLALGLVNWICTLSLRKIILGGGIMTRQQLFPAVCEEVRALLNRYIAAPDIVPPALGTRAGVLGAIALAEAMLLDHGAA
jgi:fructokinase